MRLTKEQVASLKGCDKRLGRVTLNNMDDKSLEQHAGDPRFGLYVGVETELQALLQASGDFCGTPGIPANGNYRHHVNLCVECAVKQGILW